MLGVAGFRGCFLHNILNLLG